MNVIFVQETVLALEISDCLWNPKPHPSALPWVGSSLFNLKVSSRLATGGDAVLRGQNTGYSSAVVLNRGGVTLIPFYHLENQYSPLARAILLTGPMNDSRFYLWDGLAARRFPAVAGW